MHCGGFAESRNAAAIFAPDRDSIETGKHRVAARTVAHN
jgi:hypothetical protein